MGSPRPIRVPLDGKFRTDGEITASTSPLRDANGSYFVCPASPRTASRSVLGFPEISRRCNLYSSEIVTVR